MVVKNETLFLVTEWICAESVGQTPNDFPTIEVFMRKVVDLKKARCDDVFRTEEDDLESATETLASGVSNRTTDDEKGVLSTLMELMGPHMKKDAKSTRAETNIASKRHVEMFGEGSGKRVRVV